MKLILIYVYLLKYFLSRVSTFLLQKNLRSFDDFPYFLQLFLRKRVLRIHTAFLDRKMDLHQGAYNYKTLRTIVYSFGSLHLKIALIYLNSLKIRVTINTR